MRSPGFTMEKKMNDTMSDADKHARAAAHDAYENNFSSRRGTGQWEGEGKAFGFYIYDNNPWADDPTRRDRLYAELVAFLERRGCRLAERATYPTVGEDAGYTLALIFVSADQDNAIADHVAARDFAAKQLGTVFAPLN